ncbi:hypothetical protein AGMMS50230_21220 [Spirochaetia bacterium]|nr:hypothetical protein AGMMS50230_21220 [Spirochaetia bacterium]
MNSPKTETKNEMLKRQQNEKEQRRLKDNFRKAEIAAKKDYPDEVWLTANAVASQIKNLGVEGNLDNIFVAQQRIPKSKRQRKILKKEIIQAKILTKLGSIVYLIPEVGPIKMKHPDAIVNGIKMEFKNIEGSIDQLQTRYKESRNKGIDDVFITFDPKVSFTKRQITNALAGVIHKKGYKKGRIIVQLPNSDKVYFWSVKDLR